MKLLKKHEKEETTEQVQTQKPEEKEEDKFYKTWESYDKDDEEHVVNNRIQIIKQKLGMLGYPIAGLFFVMLLLSSTSLIMNPADVLVWFLFAGWFLSAAYTLLFVITLRSTLNHLLVFINHRMGKAVKVITYLSLDKTKCTYVIVPGKKREVKIRGNNYYLTTRGVIYDLDMNAQAAIAIEGNRQMYDITDATPALDEGEVNSILVDLAQVAMLSILEKFEGLTKYGKYILIALGAVVVLSIVILMNLASIMEIITAMQAAAGVVTQQVSLL